MKNRILAKVRFQTRFAYVRSLTWPMTRCTILENSFMPVIICFRVAAMIKYFILTRGLVAEKGIQGPCSCVLLCQCCTAKDWNPSEEERN